MGHHEGRAAYTMNEERAGTPGVEETRGRLSRHLGGRGLEIGPGHVPYPVPPGVSVRYLDRWRPEENRALFAELGDADFPVPDVVCDLDRDRLGPIPTQSQDFVIASHVLEHVAEPIGLLCEIYRVLRPGGVLLLLLPDRRLTFDHRRSSTSLEHLIEEHRAGLSHVPDDHILEFLEHTESADGWQRLRANPSDLADAVALHRSRSVHVHCWNAEEFFEVILYSMRKLELRWEFVDAVLPADEDPDGIEFGWVLRRSATPVEAHAAADELSREWHEWKDRPRSSHRRSARSPILRQVIPVARAAQRVLGRAWGRMAPQQRPAR